MAAWAAGHRHRPSQSSISSLAFPLSPQLTLRLQSSFLLAGIADASQYRRAIDSIQANPHIRASLTKCTLLQVFILVCVLGVDYLILPAWTRGATSERGNARMDPETAKFYFQLFWLYPLIGLSFLLSGSFFSNVATRAHSDIPSSSKSSSSRSSSATFKNQSSLLSRTLIIGVYLLISAVLSRIPFLGRPLSFLYLSLISSYYCFEYRFLSQSLVSLRSRVEYLEARWVYFLGFGLSPTLLSSSLFSSSTLNLAIWSLLFPLYLLMAATSDPLPYDPIKPAKSHDLPGQEEVSNRGTTAFARKSLNPEARLPDWWPARIPVLSLAVLLDDLVSGFVKSFLRSSSSGPGHSKKSAEGYSAYGAGASNGSAGGLGGGYQNDAYAARRDAYNFRPPQPSNAHNNANAHLQAGFGNVISAPNITSSSSGFARQADAYFGKSGNSSSGSASGVPPPRRNDGYGVGKAAGVQLRSESALGAGDSAMQSRRRGVGSQ